MEVAWIPSKFAKVGKILKLRTGDKWVDGWRVDHVGASLTEEQTKQAKKDFKIQRIASDIKRGDREPLLEK